MFKASIRILMPAAVLLLGGMTPAAAIIGPVYPPPGGVDFATSGGQAGDPGGINFHFTNFDPGQFSELYWGPASADAVLLTLNGGPADDILAFSSVSGNAAEWTGTSFYANAGVDVPTRFTLTITGLGANPFVDAGSVGADPGIGVLADDSAGLDFTANLLFEALVQGTWQAVNTLPQPGGGYTSTSFSGGFFYEPPTIGVSPDSWGSVKGRYAGIR